MLTPGRCTLCADDFALTPAVSRGILRLLERGRIDATGCMTGRPAWALFARELRAFPPPAQFGLHLNLTAGPPLAPMPRFAPERFPALGGVVARALAGRLPQTEVATEIGRQLDSFAEGLGRPPDFVDGHQHVHALPGIRALLLAELGQRGWRPWLRDPGDEFCRILARGSFPRKALVVGALTAGFSRAAAAAGFATNDGFAGFSAFDPAADYPAQFARYFVAPGPRHLVMCHPGEADDPDLAGLDPVVATRPQELAFLLSPGCDARRAGAGP